MSVTLHKLLIHRETIVEHALQPVGALSEEAQEATNKLYKSFRESHAMKHAREATNRDVFNRLLAYSDPYLYTLRKELPKEHVEMHDAAKQLLKNEDD